MLCAGSGGEPRAENGWGGMSRLSSLCWRRGAVGRGEGSGLPPSLPSAFVSAAPAGREQETGGGREARQEE